MAPVNIKFVVSFSSQDSEHKASNLVNRSQSKCWLSNKQDRSGRAELVLQLEQPSQLAFLDIGTVWCATLEVRVGRSDWPQNTEYKPLIPPVVLMSPLDCRLNRSIQNTQMFTKKDFSQDVALEHWDRLQIICRQPYRKDAQLGVSFIHVKNNSTSEPEDKTNTSITTSNLATKSVLDSSSIKKMFFGDKVAKNEESPTDMLKYKLMKMAGSTDSACDHEEALTRTAKLVLKASENSKSFNPRRVSSPLVKKGLFSEHLAKKCDIPIEEDINLFLSTLKLSAADVDTVTIADLRHKFEKRKKRKLTKDEKRKFFEICQNFISDLFDPESISSGHNALDRIQNGLVTKNINSTLTLNLNENMQQKPQMMEESFTAKEKRYDLNGGIVEKTSTSRLAAGGAAGYANICLPNGSTCNIVTEQGSADRNENLITKNVQTKPVLEYSVQRQSVPQRKLKNLTKASFDILRQFKMDILDDDSESENDGITNLNKKEKQLNTSEHELEQGQGNHNQQSFSPTSACGSPQPLFNGEVQTHGGTSRWPHGQNQRTPTSLRSNHQWDTDHSPSHSKNGHFKNAEPSNSVVGSGTKLKGKKASRDSGTISAYYSDQLERSTSGRSLAGSSFTSDSGKKLMYDLHDAAHTSSKAKRGRLSGQKSRGHKKNISKARAGKNPVLGEGQSRFCDQCYGQFPADSINLHRAFCCGSTPLRPSYRPATESEANSQEMFIDDDVEYVECPICLDKFPQDVLLVHASECGI